MTRCAVKPIHSPSARRGFTLIEVLATLVLLGIVMPVAMRGVSLGLDAASTARHTSEAASLAETKLNELVIEQSTGSSGVSGDFPDHPGYQWTSESVGRDYGLTEMTVRVSWTQRGQERNISVSTLFLPPASSGGLP